LGGIDLQGLIDLAAEFGTLLGGPAGLKRTKGAGVFVVPLIGKLVRWEIGGDRGQEAVKKCWDRHARSERVVD